MNISLIAFALFFSIFGILLTTSSTFVLTSDAAMYKVTSGGSLNVILQPSPFPVIKGSQTNLKVSFHQKGSSAVQPHVDYDLTIMKDDKKVFQFSSQAGHPNQPLHTVEGIVTIPYTFQQEGTYVINITVYGILHHLIKPETAQFTMVVARGGSLNVILQPSPFPVIKGSQTNLKVSFHQKGSSAVQPHVDYDLTIMKDDKKVFQLSNSTGYPNQPLHTTGGIVTIPYTFQQEGTYVINITVYDILYNPIKPETSQFTINVN
jgi:Fe-S cluster assembly iron-binding protein IscA